MCEGEGMARDEIPWLALVSEVLMDIMQAVSLNELVKFRLAKPIINRTKK